MLSDLHLGGSLRPPLDFRARREVVRLDRAVTAFLDWHRENPLLDAEGRVVPWHLVLNGDNLDFLHMGLVPEPEEAARLAASEAAQGLGPAGSVPGRAGAGAADPAAVQAARARAVTAKAAADRAEVNRVEAALGRRGAPAIGDEELLFGLDFSEDRSRWKLARIAAWHRRCFPALCRFLEAGHRITFVAGNHDADLCFEGVQSDLRHLIARHAESDAEGVAARIDFAPWFVMAPGAVWLEHGHRFDPYNTFPDPLEPVPFDDNQRRLAPTFSHWGLRYFANRVRTFPLHDLEQWRFKDFMHWAWNRAGMGLLRLVMVWVAFLGRYLRDTSVARLRGRFHAVDRARRRARLRRVAQRTGLPLGRLLSIESLHQPHVGASLGRLCLGLYLDRVALVVLTLLGVVSCLSMLDGVVVIFWLAVIGWGTVALWRLFDRHRPAVDCHPVHGQMSDPVGRLAGTPVVVFGHTHHPVLRRMGGGTWWANPGSWEHVGRHHVHGEGRCTCSSRYLVITQGAGRVRPRLNQWCVRTHEPVAGRP